MKQPFFLLLIVAIASISLAQSTDDYYKWKKQQHAAYGAYKDSARADYEAFRKKANADYAKFREDCIRNVEVEPALEPEPVPKPPRPVIVPPDRLPSSDPLPYSEVISPPETMSICDIPLPVIDDPVEDPTLFSFNFYGTYCGVELQLDQRFRLKDISTKSLSLAWQHLSSESYDPLLRDCLQARTTLQLDDWGYIDFVRTLTRSFFDGESNEAVLLQQYLLINSGMKVRLCFVNGKRLVMLVPFQENIIGYPYYDADKMKFFVLQQVKPHESVKLYDKGFDNENQPSIQMRHLPNLPMSMTASRTFASKKYPSVKATISVNRNLIDMMNNRPWHGAMWNYYAEVGLSQEVKDALYPGLLNQIQGKDQVTAANMLIDFVQQGFDYATDQEQFGKERSLFADESFFYPYNDCEDRSILYSILVHDLLGLEVVLLHFENHLATAVHFTERVEGDFVFIGDELYVVCDPTYIGASVGMAMPNSKKEGALKDIWTVSYGESHRP